MDSPNAQRIVLRFEETFILEEVDIIIAFFESAGLKVDDYYSHLCPPSSPESNKMYIVLDLYTRRFPRVDFETIKYQVFKVKKKDDHFTFEELNESARRLARQRGVVLNWGTNRSG